MEYEWDIRKNESNYARRGIDFSAASGIFDGPLVETVDTRSDYGEVRVQAIGKADDRLLVVIYTDRGGRRRIISARYANRRERAQWRNLSG